MSKTKFLGIPAGGKRADWIEMEGGSAGGGGGGGNVKVIDYTHDFDKAPDNYSVTEDFPVTFSEVKKMISDGYNPVFRVTCTSEESRKSGLTNILYIPFQMLFAGTVDGAETGYIVFSISAPQGCGIPCTAYIVFTVDEIGCYFNQGE